MVEQQPRGDGAALPRLQAASGLGCRSPHEQRVAAARVAGRGGGPRLPFAVKRRMAATRLVGGGRARQRTAVTRVVGDWRSRISLLHGSGSTGCR